MDDGYTKDELFGVALLTAHEYVEKLKIDDKRKSSITAPHSFALFSPRPLTPSPPTKAPEINSRWHMH